MKSRISEEQKTEAKEQVRLECQGAERMGVLVKGSAEWRDEVGDTEMCSPKGG